VCTKVDIRAVLDKMGIELPQNIVIPEKSVSCANERSARKLL
jgi:hypothetical protein